MCDKIVIIEMEDTDYLFDIIEHNYTLPPYLKLYFKIVFYFLYILCTMFSLFC